MIKLNQNMSAGPWANFLLVPLKRSRSLNSLIEPDVGERPLLRFYGFNLIFPMGGKGKNYSHSPPSRDPSPWSLRCQVPEIGNAQLSLSSPFSLSQYPPFSHLSFLILSFPCDLTDPSLVNHIPPTTPIILLFLLPAPVRRRLRPE